MHRDLSLFIINNVNWTPERATTFEHHRMQHCDMTVQLTKSGSYVIIADRFAHNRTGHSVLPQHLPLLGDVNMPSEAELAAFQKVMPDTATHPTESGTREEQGRSSPESGSEV